ncbi:transposable element Tcb2 transposase [Trichonephila clavipes]|nr:transposable element Tcb2 transposase [Trichonephila clavipes]
MDWKAYSPALSPIEHVWDALGKRIAARFHHPENTQQLKQMLIEKWVLLPQEMLHQLVLSMRRRWEATIASCPLWRMVLLPEGVGEKGFLESRSPTFRIDSSRKDMRRTGFECPD